MNVDPTGNSWKKWLGVAVAAVVATVAVVACAVSLGTAAAPIAVAVALASGVVAAGISAAEQHIEAGEISAPEVIYDGLIGVTNGALATSGISAVGSMIAGAIVGGASSVGSDLAFGDGNISRENARQSRQVPCLCPLRR